MQQPLLAFSACVWMRRYTVDASIYSGWLNGKANIINVAVDKSGWLQSPSNIRSQFVVSWFTDQSQLFRAAHRAFKRFRACQLCHFHLKCKWRNSENTFVASSHNENPIQKKKCRQKRRRMTKWQQQLLGFFILFVVCRKLIHSAQLKCDSICLLIRDREKTTIPKVSSTKTIVYCIMTVTATPNCRRQCKLLLWLIRSSSLHFISFSLQFLRFFTVQCLLFIHFRNI